MGDVVEVAKTITWFPTQSQLNQVKVCEVISVSVWSVLEHVCHSTQAWASLAEEQSEERTFVAVETRLLITFCSPAQFSRWNVNDVPAIHPLV